MLKRMLVGINGSRFSQAAARLALAWAERHRAELVGLGIVDVPYLTEPELMPIGVSAFKIERDAVLVEAATVAIAGHLAEFKRQCADANVSCRTRQLSGSPEELLAYEAQCADLLVMGKKSAPDDGNTAASRVLRQTVRHTTRPVLCVDENGGVESSAGPVLVAYDGSAHAAKSLQIFNTLGLAAGREIQLVLVAGDSIEQHIVDMAAEYLMSHGHRVQAKIRPAGCSIGVELLTEARRIGAGLIVMGAYGQSPIREFVFGSVTSTVLRESQLPLFLYH